jgi:hypothetical protein
MLSTKIRTTIVALVASASFAAATVVPTVSQARPNNGAYAKSSAAMTSKMHGDLCEYLGETFEAEVGLAVHAKTTKESNEHLKHAEGDIQAAQENGCAWAA